MAQTSLNSTGVASSGSLSFQSNGTTTAVTIDTSQNVGVGTSSPSQKLDVAGNANLSTTSYLTWNGSTSYSIQGVGGASGYIRTVTNGNEAWRTDVNGNLLVGTTNSNPIGSNVSGLVSSPSGNFSVSRDAAPALDLNRYTSDGTVARFYRSASQVGRIDVTTTATSYVTSSDYRLKENPQPMTGALAVVAQLKPCTYTWKVNGQQGQGFIAHELAEVCPDAVVGDKDEVETVEIKDEEGNVIGTEDRPIYQGIDTSFLVATLTAAIQEQQALIQTLRADVEALKAK